MTSGTPTQPVGAFLVRFSELKQLQKSPADILLSRYQRERFSVIGRASERLPGTPGADVGANLNFGYIRCATGKGNCSHKHPNWEIFIPMSGKWKITLEGGVLDGRHELLVGPWDVVTIPGETYHEAVNVSDEQACLLSLNPGKEGATYTIHPNVLEELRGQFPQVAAAARDAIDVTVNP